MSTQRRSTPAARGADPAIQPNVGRARGPGSTGLAIPALLLFASGSAALVYQVLWSKQLSLVIGIDVYGVTTAVSAFFAGLALGGALFGRWADRLARPYLLYALLELGVAVLGIATTLALGRAAPPCGALEARATPLAWALLLALVGVPAVLMGGTLPVLIRSWAPQAGHIGAAGGSLYVANTAGAITGALLPPFILIPQFGVRGAALAAAALNLAVASAALGCEPTARPGPSAKPSLEPIPAPSQARVALMLYTLYAPAGAAATAHTPCRTPFGARHRSRDWHHGRRAPALSRAGAACLCGASTGCRACCAALFGELRRGVRPAAREPCARRPSGVLAEP
jgi:MFS family permease